MVEAISNDNAETVLGKRTHAAATGVADGAAAPVRAGGEIGIDDMIGA